MTGYEGVGQPVPRVDAVEKVTGRALYGDDLHFPTLLYGKAVRSPYAHAKIADVTVTKAQRLPGVKTIVIGKDIPVLGGESLKDYPFLAIAKVRYVGEPVAVVAAVDEETAEEAVDLIAVQYEELPVVLDPRKAMESDAPIIHEELHTYEHLPSIKPVENSNICHHVHFVKGDPEKGFEESDAVFEDTFTTHMVQHGAIEPHMAVAQVDPGGRITTWVTNDAPHRLRKDLAEALGIPFAKLRVVVPPYMGGGFGGKGGLKVETLCITLALRTGGRPVKMALTREEVFTASLVRHPSVVQLKTGVKRNGTLWTRTVKAIYDTGAYAEKGPRVCMQGCVAAVGPYKIPHVKVDGYCVYTNKPIAGAYRGYGHPQIAWAHESQMDIIAHELGIDPVTIRLQNAVQQGDTSPTGHQTLHSVGIRECIRQVAQHIEWGDKPRDKNRGKGIACAYKNTKTPSGSSALVKVSQDGSVEVLTSSVEIGQGAKTILSQMVVEELGGSLDRVTVSTPDTDVTPYDASTTSSRTTFHMGNALRTAARDARRQLFEMASVALQVEVTSLLAEQGIIYARDDRNRALSFAEVIRGQYGAGLDIIGKGSYYPIFEGETGGKLSPPSAFWMFGSHGVEIEVDVETGRVRILRAVGAHDVGKVVNPVTCAGQIEGGIVQEMGATLLEEMVVEGTGHVLNPSFADYKLATALDIPDVTPLMIEETHKGGPWGAKGIGELTVVPTASAIANAVFDAVGIRIKDLPITHERILKALKDKELQKQG